MKNTRGNSGRRHSILSRMASSGAKRSIGLAPTSRSQCTLRADQFHERASRCRNAFDPFPHQRVQAAQWHGGAGRRSSDLGSLKYASARSLRLRPDRISKSARCRVCCSVQQLRQRSMRASSPMGEGEFTLNRLHDIIDHEPAASHPEFAAASRQFAAPGAAKPTSACALVAINACQSQALRPSCRCQKAST